MRFTDVSALDFLKAVLTFVPPVGFAYIVQLIGERRRWRVSTMLKAAVLIGWFWVTLAVAIVTRMSIVGLLVSAAILGLFMLAIYTLITWLRKDAFKKYEEDLAKKRARDDLSDRSSGEFACRPEA